MDFKQAIATIADFTLGAGISNFKAQLQCSDGEHDGKIIQISVAVLCGCDECVMERSFNDQESCPNYHSEDNEAEPEVPQDDDDNDEIGEQWKNN